MNEKSRDRQYCAQDIARRQTKTHNTKKINNQDPSKKNKQENKEERGNTDVCEDVSRVTTNIVGDKKNYIKKRKDRLSFEKLIFRHDQPVCDDDQECHDTTCLSMRSTSRHLFHDPISDLFTTFGLVSISSASNT